MSSSEMGPTYVLDKTAVATEALSQYHGVVLVTGGCEMADAAGERIIGIVQEEISADDVTRGPRAADVRVLGISYAIAGGACTLGGPVAVNAAGRFVNAAGAGTVPAGICLRAATTDGDATVVLLTPGMPALAA